MHTFQFIAWEFAVFVGYALKIRALFVFRVRRGTAMLVAKCRIL